MATLYFTYSRRVDRVQDANRHLIELNTLYVSTIETLAMAIDAKDQVTHGHIRRVRQYTVGLARHLGVTDQSLIQAIEAAALLHDMGKLAVPEYILNKPGALTPAEFERMKLHAASEPTFCPQSTFRTGSYRLSDIPRELGRLGLSRRSQGHPNSDGGKDLIGR